MFLKNEWYVVALSTELSTQPIQRWILNEPLALFRTHSGKAVALVDRCPHRGAPLSMGRVHGETIACGYHGFTFDVTGQCVDLPGTDFISPKACVQSHPLMERWGWVFAWMGDAAHAIEFLPDVERDAARIKFREVLFTVRDENGTWNDRVFPRSAGYGTAMSVLALLQVEMTKAHALTHAEKPAQ